MATNTGSFSPYTALFKVTLRQMFWSRKTVLILLGCLFSLVITIVFRFVSERMGDVNSFIPYITLSLYGLLTSLCAIFYGTAIISDEVDGKGLTYLQMRPLRKSVILLSKFTAYLVGTVVLITASHLILTAIVVTHPKLEKGVLFHFGMSLRYSASLALTLLTYGTLAAVLAARFKHPVLWGLLFVLGWEQLTLAPILQTSIKRLSVKHYLLSLFPTYRLQPDILNGMLGDAPPSAWIAFGVLCLMTAGFLWLAIRTFREREYLM